MKKLFVLICSLVLITACSSATNTNTSPPPANSSISKATPVTDADVIAKEKEAWATLEKKDYAAFGNLLAPEYVEIGSTAAFDKAGVLAFVKDLQVSNPDFSNWKVLPVGKDIMLVTYDVSVKSSYKGQQDPDGPYHASAAWVNRDGKLVAVYFQETLAGNAPPPPSTEEPAQSVGAPSRTAPAAGNDGIANEKLVWDALKRKDFESFANYLDEAQIEVEADGVHNKAESVKGVRSFDFSKAQPGDFKVLNLSPEAMLVTYVVKSSEPKMPTHRAATIWVKRADKWRALFHQETPEEKPAPAKSPEKKPS